VKGDGKNVGDDIMSRLQNWSGSRRIATARSDAWWGENL